MKILMLTSSFPGHLWDHRGRFVWDWANAWTEAGDTVTVLAAHPGGGALSEETWSNVKIERLPSWLPQLSSKLPLGLGSRKTLFGGMGVSEELGINPLKGVDGLVATAALWRRCAQLASDVDLIISHWMGPLALVGSLVAQTAWKPHGLVEHGGGLRLLQRRPKLVPIMARVMERAAVIQWVSAHQQRIMTRLVGEELSTERHLVFPMPPSSKWAPVHGFRVPSERPRILFAGRLVEAKGADLFLRALRLVEGVEATIAGDGPEMGRLVSAAGHDFANRKINFFYYFFGADMPALYDSHDVTVVPSLAGSMMEEGMPRVLLEAMSRGSVVVASASGGMKELLEADMPWALFRPGSSFQLAEVLNSLVSDPAGLTDKSREVMKVARRFNWGGLRQLWLRSLGL